ncbi:MAG: hypothetical protein AAFR46_16950 [Pseudomonadota bacterium]
MKRLSGVNFEWDPVGVLPQLDDLKTADEHNAFFAVANPISRAMAGFQPLSAAIRDRLAAAPVVLADPRIKFLDVYLKLKGAGAPEFDGHSTLRIDVPRDPRLVPGKAEGAQPFGAFAVDVARDAAARARGWPGFPFDLLTEALDGFEAGDHWYRQVLKDAAVPRKKARCRVVSAISAERTWCQLEIIGTESSLRYEKLIFDEPGIRWSDLGPLSRVKFSSKGIEIGVAHQVLSPSFVLTRQHMPEDIADLLGING